ncbi:hypothetical protein VIGAN_11017300, partial [Vigna angularis var. angularis]
TFLAQPGFRLLLLAQFSPNDKVELWYLSNLGYLSRTLGRLSCYWFRSSSRSSELLAEMKWENSLFQKTFLHSKLCQ